MKLNKTQRNFRKQIKEYEKQGKIPEKYKPVRVRTVTFEDDASRRNNRYSYENNKDYDEVDINISNKSKPESKSELTKLKNAWLIVLTVLLIVITVQTFIGSKSKVASSNPLLQNNKVDELNKVTDYLNESNPYINNLLNTLVNQKLYENYTIEQMENDLIQLSDMKNKLKGIDIEFSNLSIKYNSYIDSVRNLTLFLKENKNKTLDNEDIRYINKLIEDINQYSLEVKSAIDLIYNQQ